MERQFVSFFISGIKYCIDIMDVEEVVRETKFTKMPDMPTYVEGIMNLRGIVVPVMSVKKKLGLYEEEAAPEIIEAPAEGASAADLKALELLKAKKKNATRKLIIVRIDGVLVGFLVDNLDRVFAIEENSIQSADGVSSAVDRALVEGVAKINEEVYIILNVKKMIGFDEKVFIKEEIIE
ncbi:MAG: hypothetical protein A2Y33_07740 [Spirochaetes bacterium GWF1_51_8]|nr:MAG: hypothetical protein A2Y33_07740 [Spirochaetes bacterium GWF1_51_8]